VSESPQPAIRTANRNAGIQICEPSICALVLLITLLQGVPYAHTRPDIYDTSIFISCSTKDTIHQQLHSYCNSGIFYVCAILNTIDVKVLR